MPVRVTTFEVSFELTLLPAGANGFRLVIPLGVFKALGVGEEAELPLELVPDTGRTAPDIPPELGEVLRSVELAAACYEAQSVSLKRQIVSQVLEAKSEASRMHRARAAVSNLVRGR